jgi:integrase
VVEFNSIFKDEFQDYLSLRETCMSVSGYKHYRCYLKSFDAYLTDCGLGERQITEATINGWIVTLTGKSSSKANEIISIRKFIRYLQTLGVPAYVPITPKVLDDYIPYIFSDDELEMIFAAADDFKVNKTQQNPYMQIEFPMIMRLLYGCGLRIGETLALQMKNIDLDGGIITILHAKKDKQRLVPMASTLTDVLRRYCLALGIVGNPAAYLFPGIDPAKLASIRSMRNKFDVIAKSLGITLKEREWHERGPCMHCFRHVFAFKSFAKSEQSGRSIDESVPFLSVYLGHDCLNETEKYLKFSSELYPEALELFEEYTEGLFPEVDYEQ